jgi:Zn-dependent protease with chaperone function
MSMDFFERQDQARASSKQLILLFLITLPFVIAAVYVVSVLVYFVGWAFVAFWGSALAETRFGGKDGVDFFISLWQPGLLLWVALITLLVIAWGSFSKVRQLAPGGGVVATLLGGQRLDPATKELNELRLLHVVEEMAVASGTPMPDIYILRREFGLNSFVAGYTMSDMVLCATEGCIRYLTRDELQGVIAHEYSHILNGDMRLGMRLMGWVHGLFSITLFSYWVMSKTYSEKERDMTGQPEPRGVFAILTDLFVLVIGFLLAFIGWNGAFFGRIIKGAVSRQREFLADAAAVQFTRYPEGLAGALTKAKTWPEGTAIHSTHAEEASHIYFCNGLDEDRIWLTSTHPPLGERLNRVEVMMGRSFVPEPVKVRENERTGPVPFPRIPIGKRQSEPPKTTAVEVATIPQQILSKVGVLTEGHLNYAGRLMEKLPDSLRAAAHDPSGATALTYSLLLSSEKTVRDGQLRYLSGQAGEEMAGKVETLRPVVSAQSDRVKIPLVELSLPSLRRLSPDEYESLSKHIQALTAADQQLDLFEFALQKILRRHLEPAFRTVPKTEVRYHAIAGLKFACSTLLSALAHTGQETAEEAHAAFDRGVRSLGVTAADFRFMPLTDCTLNSIEIALNNVAEAAPRLKKLFLQACAETVIADGQVQAREAELLRAIADSLDCPIPPFLPDAAGFLPSARGS